MMLEKRGSFAFIKDRSQRIVVPLVIGLPVIMLVTGAALVLGALVVGADPRTLQPPEPPPASTESGWLSRIHLMHLWFLYYLAILYSAALILRPAFALVSTRFRAHRSDGRPIADSKLAHAVDTAVRLSVHSVIGPVVLALPLAAWYINQAYWSPWGGLPAPFSIVPDSGACIAYGSFFAFGWLMQRQPELLTALRKRWSLHAVLAGISLVLCRAIAGSTPEWGPNLAGEALVVYTVSYMIGAWSLTFAGIGAALRFLSRESRMRRYLADSSYWLYLMHLAVLFFFAQIFDALAWHWSVEYLLSIAGTLAILLPSYHWLVRATFLGAILNGRRQPRSRSASTHRAGASAVSSG
jgi:hypothetical protein